jgi:hypothetical protein
MLGLDGGVGSALHADALRSDRRAALEHPFEWVSFLMFDSTQTLV